MISRRKYNTGRQVRQDVMQRGTNLNTAAGHKGAQNSQRKQVIQNNKAITCLVNFQNRQLLFDSFVPSVHFVAEVLFLGRTADSRRAAERQKKDQPIVSGNLKNFLLRPWRALRETRSTLVSLYLSEGCLAKDSAARVVKTHRWLHDSSREPAPVHDG